MGTSKYIYANLLQTNLLRTCYGETGVMDFGLIGLRCSHSLVSWIGYCISAANE